jgi:glycosyltransferase involved in cell wall biosynthesis
MLNFVTRTPSRRYPLPPMSEPAFSIIMPLYNHERYVTEAVRSVQAQTYRHWELIICDDGSKDRSGAIADELAAGDARITVIHQPNAGLPAARNAAIRVARNPWLALLDSDDAFLPEALAHHAATIAAAPGCLFTHGYYHRLTSDGAIEQRTGEQQDRPTTPRELFSRMYLTPSCVAYHRQLIDRHGEYDMRLPTHEDYDFFLRVGRETAYVPVNRPVCLRRRHDTNISAQSGRTRTIEANVLHRFYTQYGGDRLVTPQQYDRRMARLNYSAGRNYVQAGFHAQGIAALRRSLALRPTGLKARCFLLWANALAWRGRHDDRIIPDFSPMPEALRFKGASVPT